MVGRASPSSPAKKWCSVIYGFILFCAVFPLGPRLRGAGACPHAGENATTTPAALLLGPTTSTTPAASLLGLGFRNEGSNVGGSICRMFTPRRRASSLGADLARALRPVANICSVLAKTLTLTTPRLLLGPTPADLARRPRPATLFSTVISVSQPSQVVKSFRNFFLFFSWGVGWGSRPTRDYLSSTCRRCSVGACHSRTVRAPCDPEPSRHWSRAPCRSRRTRRLAQGRFCRLPSSSVLPDCGAFPH